MEINKILQKLGIASLNAMQEDAYKTIMGRANDVVVLSPTGTGKTLAYLLPVTQLVDAADNDLQVIVVVPGRELALQSSTVMGNMGAGLRSYACYGGHPAMDEHRQMRQICPQIVFGTPGRLNDHLDKGNLLADKVGILVIDEFDKCLEMGFHDAMERLLSKLPNLKKRILLSATDADEIPHFVNARHVERLDYLVDEPNVRERINIYRVESPEKDKLGTLRQLLLGFGDQSTIVFLNYRSSVERTAAFLEENGFSVSAFHGGLGQKDREAALYRFSNGSACIFVSTDLGSRGLDIPDVGNIVHYHIPETEENYLHRVGRTARWDKTGKAFFILSEGETIPEYVEGEVADFEIANNENLKPALPRMTTLYLGKGKKEKISKGDIVGFLCKKAGLEKDDIGRIDVKDYYCYVAVSRSKAQLVLRKANGEKIKGVRTIWEEIAP